MARSLKISYNAPFTLSFAAACVLAFLLHVVTNGGANRVFFSVGEGMNYANPFTYLRLVTHVLGHYDPQHLIYNLTLLLLIGPLLDEKHGWRRLLAVAAVTALVSALPMLIFPGRLLGASGVVFAFIVLASYTRAISGALPLTFIVICFLFVGREIYVGIVERDSVAQFSHILGGLVGAVFALRWKDRAPAAAKR